MWKIHIDNIARITMKRWVEATKNEDGDVTDSSIASVVELNM